jgi:hypothetical protein
VKLRVLACLLLPGIPALAAGGDTAPDLLIRGTYVGGVAVALLLGAGALVALVRRWRARSAHAVAFRKLLMADELSRPERSREFALVVSDALRSYIEKRFRTPAVRRTTDEIMEGLQCFAAASLLAHAGTLKDILVHCDRAKFGGKLLSGAQIDALQMRAWQFVHRTRIPGAGRNGRNQ